MDVLGYPELKDDPLYRTQSARVANRQRINAIVGGKLALHTSAYWVETLNAAGVPSGPVHAVADVVTDPQIQAQNMVMEVEQPGYGPVRMLGFPMKFAGTPCSIRRPAPDLGQHSDEVLAELGFTVDQCRTFRDQGVI
jgi:CoA:oxalate CoA-transferase